MDKLSDQPFADVTGKVGTHPHRKQVGTDDRGKLSDRVTQQIAGQRACNQFIDQAASGDYKNGKE